MSVRVVFPNARSILFGHRWLCMRPNEKTPMPATLPSECARGRQRASAVEHLVDRADHVVHVVAGGRRPGDLRLDQLPLVEPFGHRAQALVVGGGARVVTE